MTPGQTAYEAYSAAVGGASAVTGTALPSWAGQRADIRTAWEQAAGAVLRSRVAAGDYVSTGVVPAEQSEVIVLPPNTPQPG